MVFPPGHYKATITPMASLHLWCLPELSALTAPDRLPTQTDKGHLKLPLYLSEIQASDQSRFLLEGTLVIIWSWWQLTKAMKQDEGESFLVPVLGRRSRGQSSG